ncbi:MAG: DUF3822 family protein [Bacteroidetes bacterium]|nr:DUF3822 family protein [Bacteroidota bacterium]
MTGFESTTLNVTKGKDALVSILDESLFSGEQKKYKLFCTVDPEFISVAAVDRVKNKYTGFEGFHFSKSLTDEQLSQKITDLTRQSTILQKIDFSHSSVQVSGSRFTLVPSALFKAEDAEQYFYFNHPKRDGEEIHFDTINSFDAVNIFSVSTLLMTELKKIFENFSVHHQLTSLIEASRLHAGNKSVKSMFIHIHSSLIEVIVAGERKLIFANSFPYKGTEDGIYFVMMVCDQLSLNPEMVEVLVSGEIEKEGAFFKQLHRYIRHISFSERIKAATFTYGFDEIPSHFYHAAFSHILCEL